MGPYGWPYPDELHASSRTAEVRVDVLPFCVLDDVLLVDRVRGHESESFACCLGEDWTFQDTQILILPSANQAAH